MRPPGAGDAARATRPRRSSSSAWWTTGPGRGPGIFLAEAGRAFAAMQGEPAVSEADVQKAAVPVLRHRVSVQLPGPGRGADQRRHRPADPRRRPAARGAEVREEAPTGGIAMARWYRVFGPLEPPAAWLERLLVLRVLPRRRGGDPAEPTAGSLPRETCERPRACPAHGASGIQTRSLNSPGGWPRPATRPRLAWPHGSDDSSDEPPASTRSTEAGSSTPTARCACAWRIPADGHGVYQADEAGASSLP